MSKKLPKRVLHITSSYNGGIYSFIKNKMQAISKDEVIMDVAAFEAASQSVKIEIKNCEGKVYQLPNPKTEGFVKFFKNFARILDNTSYDMVHCHQMGHRALPFYLIAKQKKVKRFVIHAHSAGITNVESISKKTKTFIKVDRIINRFINAELVTCGEIATQYAYGKNTSKSITLLTNSIDEEKFLYRLDKKAVKQLKINNAIPCDKYIIGQVGRLDSNKNQEFTINLAYELAKSTDCFFWILVGQGKNYQKLEHQIKKLNLSDTVKLLGKREDVNKLYKLMDKLVFPSHTEGFGIVGVEAQASGVVSIVSDTISDEIDLDLDLINFVSLNNINEWISELQTVNSKAPETDLIRMRLEKRKYTNRESAELYKGFILKNTNDY